MFNRTIIHTTAAAGDATAGALPADLDVITLMTQKIAIVIRILAKFLGSGM